MLRLWDFLVRALRAAGFTALLLAAVFGVIYGTVLALRAVLGP